MKKGQAYKLKNPKKHPSRHLDGFECINPTFYTEDQKIQTFYSDKEYEKFINDSFVYVGTKENLIHEFYTVNSGNRYYVLTDDLNTNLDKFEEEK